ncbi:MAG: hypothetical protein FJ206_06200 [Gemmatimonadetes bacterium]|nr:hypothetical protein [Gemmatimonadota bacterium]
MVGLFLVIALFHRSRDLALAATAVLVLLGPATLAVKMGGEQAEEAVEGAAWFNEAAVEEHEEAADLATIAALLTAVAAAVVWWRQRAMTEINRYGVAGLLVMVVITSALLGRTALAGGVIRHDEFGSASRVAPAVREDDEH